MPTGRFEGNPYDFYPFPGWATLYLCIHRS